MSFREWVAARTGDLVAVEWGDWNPAGGGSARVRLVGFDERAEADYPEGVLLAILEVLEGSRSGLSRRPDGTVPPQNMADTIAEVRTRSAEAATGEIVRIDVPYLKSVTDVDGPVLRCCMYDEFRIDYDDPSHAEHRGQWCPLHDEPQWRLSEWELRRIAREAQEADVIDMRRPPPA